MTDTTDPLTWRQLWIETTDRLGNAQHARWICEDVSGFEGPQWLTGLNVFATERGVARLDAMVKRCMGGEPLQYVLGHWGFRRLDLLVDRRVLIPRPETELLVELALERVHRQPQPWLIADLGTGSGAIALSLADELPDSSATIWATDASCDALDVARANLAGLGRRGGSVRIGIGSWWSALPDELRGTMSMVVSNPPYIADGDSAVESSVHDWEPHAALYSPDQGLEALQIISSGAAEWLRPGGWLICEIGSTQRTAALGLATAAGLVEAEVRHDLAGLDRILLARRSGDLNRNGG